MFKRTNVLGVRVLLGGAVTAGQAQGSDITVCTGDIWPRPGAAISQPNNS